MTPARLALITDVGPPDWPTKRFPTSSAISFKFSFVLPMNFRKTFQTEGPKLACSWSICQRGIREITCTKERMHIRLKGRYLLALMLVFLGVGTRTSGLAQPTARLPHTNLLVYHNAKGAIAEAKSLADWQKRRA